MKKQRPILIQVKDADGNVQMKQLVDYIESSPPGKRDKVSRTLNKMNTSTTKVIEENYRRLS